MTILSKANITPDLGALELDSDSEPSLPVRKIIHVDADAFYASVEMRENPKLKHLPLAVGGKPGSRGVVATCNYIARKFGVHSAMASSHARRLCPDLVFVSPNFPLYRDISHQIREIFLRYSDTIEPLSLDEAYLDVSDSLLFQGSATRIAEAIRQDVKNELNLTVSAGVAPNKFLAKIASDWQKPDGLFVITPNDVDAFLVNLPVSKINGVGKVTTQKLSQLGVETCSDLQKLSLDELGKKFGKQGSRLFNLCRGIDHRSLQTSRVRKSLSIEHTYAHDLKQVTELKEKGQELYEELLRRTAKLDATLRINKRYVKVKFDDFTQTTLEEMVNIHDSKWQDPNAYINMLIKAWSRSEKPVRLLGMGVRFLSNDSSSAFRQFDLFDLPR